MSELHCSRVLRGSSPDTVRIVGRLDGDDVADLAVEDLLHGLAARAVIAPAEAVDQREVLGLGVLARLKVFAQAGAIDGHRLLDERIDPFLDGIGQVEGPEVGRGGQDDQVDLVDDVLVRIEAGVLAILGDVDPRADRRDPLRSERLSSSRSGKASAIATSLTPESAVRACPAAPVPRPPQPTRPTLIVLLPAAWTSGTVKPVETPSRSPPPRRGRRALEEIAPRGGRGR